MMGGVELGLDVAFYLYPCSLFATLAVSQLVRYRHRNDQSSAVVVDEKRAEKVNKLHNRLIRLVQSFLPALLVRPHARQTIAPFSQILTVQLSWSV